MIFKLLGSALILGSSILCAQSLFKMIIERENELKALCLVFESLKDNIVSNNDLINCLSESIKVIDFKTRLKFELFCSEFKTKPYSDYFQVWNNLNINMSPLNKSDEDIFNVFFKKSGEYSIESVLNKTDTVINLLNKEINDIEENKTKHKKNYYNTAICAGILTIILII